MVHSAGKVLQLSVSPPELHDLPLNRLQQLLSLTDSCPLLDSDQLLHLTALFLYGADQPGENPLALLHCCFRGVLWSIEFLCLRESMHTTPSSADSASTAYLKLIWRNEEAHLDVSDNISEFLLRVLQFLHRLQRGFLEFFLKGTHEMNHTGQSPRLLGPIFLPRLTFKMERFDFIVKGLDCTGRPLVYQSILLTQ